MELRGRGYFDSRGWRSTVLPRNREILSLGPGVNEMCYVSERKKRSLYFVLSLIDE